MNDEEYARAYERVRRHLERVPRLTKPPEEMTGEEFAEQLRLRRRALRQLGKEIRREEKLF